MRRHGFMRTLKVGLLIFVLVVGMVFAEEKSQPQMTYDQLKLLLDILTYTQENYVEDVNAQELIYSGARGMLKPLDSYSQFMEPRIYKEMQIETEGQYGGLGIRISIRDNWLTVITPMPGTPAYRIGVLPGDRIIKIEGEPTNDITMEDAIKKLRGKPGEKVVITIAREGTVEPIDYTIIREMIKVPTLNSKMLDAHIGYIRLYDFSSNSAKNLEETLNELKSKGMDKFILDLRNNPGGLLNVAVDVVKLFIDNNKLIVYTQGRNPGSRKDYTAGEKAPYSDIPMVVLINHGSASGSEIVAGALQDHKRSLIMGTTSFGKASVQSVLPLVNDCGLKLTTARYYTPAGRSIHRDEKTGKGGIAPNIEINVSREVEAKLQVQEELTYPPGKEPSPAKKEEVKDVVLDRAVDLLKAYDIFTQHK